MRSPAVRAFVAVTAATATVAAGAYLAIGRLHVAADNAVEHPGPPATEAQTQNAVVDRVRDIVAITRLLRPAAGYLLMSCKNRDDPPYQGAAYVDFELPSDTYADQYFRAVAAALVAHGWQEGLPPNEHLFGRSVSKDGVNAVLYPKTDALHRGVARVYGQCHDVVDHHGATSDWVDITDRVH